MGKILLYLNSIRYLKLRQILWQLLNRLPKRKPTYKRACKISQITFWVSGLPKQNCLVGDCRFKIINEVRDIKKPKDWAIGAKTSLWHYVVNYNDFLNSDCIDFGKLESLIDRWIHDNPPIQKPAWDPYPTSLRIVNWIRFHLEKRCLSECALTSLATQVRSLSSRPEYHLLGNHLFANGKALVFAGIFFEGKEADKWLQQGIRILNYEIREQFLEDGGHFERCPMYQGILLEDLLDLYNLLSAHIKETGTPKCKNILILQSLVKTTITPVAKWLTIMRHPDGEIPLFNDSCLGFSPSYEALMDYGARVGFHLEEKQTSTPIALLPKSGYARLSLGDAVLFANIGSVQPSYQPGHSHADSLTFELSLHGHRTIVDTGVSGYESSSMRLQQRSTSAHNTIEIDENNSSEVWSSFRVGRRAKVSGVEVGSKKNECWIKAFHTGYRRLKGVGDHYRRWTLGKNTLEILDNLLGSGKHLVAFRLLFHPNILIKEVNHNEKIILYKNNQWFAEINIDPVFSVEKASAIYSPEFGRNLNSIQLVAKAELSFPALIRTIIKWHA